MRQILVEHARRKNAAKRGGGWQAVTLTGLSVRSFSNGVDILELDDALDLTRRTVQKDWRFATMWLRREFADSPPEPA